MKLSIRRLQPIDIGPVSMMLTDLHADARVQYPDMSEPGELDKLAFNILATIQHPHIIYLIAYDGKKPAGFFMGHMAYRPAGQPSVVGVCDELYVVPEKRGETVGLRLIREAVLYAARSGAQGVEVVAGYGRTDQRWIKLGFEPYLTMLKMPIEQAAEQFVRPAKVAA